MASITTQNAGRRLIQFTLADGKRRSLRLGKVAMRQAEAVKLYIEDLVAAKITGHTTSDKTSRWVSELNDAAHEKLVRAGLVSPRAGATLAMFLDGYIKRRHDVKAATATVYGHTRRNLVEFFGQDRPIRSITPGDADEWRLYLIGQKLADNTVRRRCGIAKQFFTAAMRKHLINSNPFADLKAAVKANPSRFYFVTLEETQKVLDACPDAQWRLLFALSRYGGLRCPSEHLLLRWQDIDWERSRFTVWSPKTEHHDGGQSRQVPLFPELAPHLQEVFAQAKEGSTFIITRYRAANSNLRTQLNRIIGHAGLEPWPKLFQNLRSTRETELAEQYPLHVVCAWLGNSQPVAAKHYLQITDAHFENAAQTGDGALYNAMQQLHVSSRNQPQGATGQIANQRICQEMRDNATSCDSLQSAEMGDIGLEPTTSRV